MNAENITGGSDRSQINAADFLNSIYTQGEAKHQIVIQNVVIQSKSTYDTLDIYNCEFANDVVIKDVDKIKNIYFSECVFYEKLLVLNCQFKSLHFSRCSFTNYFSLKFLKTRTLKFNNCQFNNFRELQLQEFSTESLIFTCNTANKDIYIHPLSVKEVILEGSETNYLLTFSNGENKEIISKFSIFTYSNYKCDYYIRNAKVNTFNLRGELKDSSLTITQVDIFTGLIDVFSNYGFLKFNAVKPLNDKSLLILKNSNLGSALISSCNFQLFKRVIIHNSVLIDLLSVNTEWCINNNIESLNISAHRENYRQLKLIAKRNENIPLQHYFEKVEMTSYLKQLRTEKTNKIDRIVLFTNSLSNDFGLNWLRAFYWLIGTSILFYSGIKMSTGQTHWKSSLFLSEVGKYLSFISPVHDFDKLFNTKNYSGSAIFLDAVSRIVGAYFIYQFISAFRKYSRK